MVKTVLKRPRNYICVIARKKGNGVEIVIGRNINGFSPLNFIDILLIRFLSAKVCTPGKRRLLLHIPQVSSACFFSLCCIPCFVFLDKAVRPKYWFVFCSLSLTVALFSVLYCHFSSPLPLALYACETATCSSILELIHLHQCCHSY